MPSSGLFSELRRRNVFKVAIAYLVLSWLLIQVTDALFPALNLPDWSVTFVVGLLIIGFIPALIFSWVYELTPEGLKREPGVDPSQSITTETGRRLNLITIGLLVGVLCVVLVGRLLLDPSGESIAPSSLDTSAAISPPQTVSEEESFPFLAVLPFKATGSDDGGFLAGGLHDDLLTRLAKLEVFRVISRTSMMEYKDTTKNMRRIGEELGADYILEGSVQALGNRVHVNAQLINAADDRHLWAESYDSELTAANLFEIQAELARAITLELQLGLSEVAILEVAAAPTQSTNAYNAYLRGLQLRDSGDDSRANLEQIVSAFEEAVRFDREFALGWAQLSRALTHLSRPWIMDVPDEQKREQAITALARARSISPGLLEAELAWVNYLSIGLGDVIQALEAIEALGERVAVDANALELKSGLYARTEKYQQAYRVLLKARRLNPRSETIAAKLIGLAVFANDCDAAGRHMRDALQLAPNHKYVIESSAWYEMSCNGKPERGVELYRRIEFTDDWSLHGARLMAIIARDYERLLELAKIPLPGPRLMNPVFDQIDLYIALRGLARDDEAALLLNNIGVALEAIDERTDAEEAFWYARARAWYHAFKGESELTEAWLEKEKQNWHVVLKGRSNEEMYNWHARILAVAGLEEEAILNLRHLLESYGAWKFKEVDLLPEFDYLKNSPAYIDLRRQYGDD
jgi:TolB-like protein